MCSKIEGIREFIDQMEEDWLAVYLFHIPTTILVDLPNDFTNP